ncbi:MAG: trehalose/maltose transport system substrate-binding protein, partial [Petroclostridium sp.]|nr:trehalose/maltose transport system substrate-binding protein [Petroclostridium sp.]
MKKVLKVLSICVAFMMFISVFAGCAKKEEVSKQADQAKSTEQAKPTEQTKPSEQPKSDKKVKIVFSRNKDSTPSSQKIIEAFQKQNPNIEVEYQETPSSVDQAHNQYVTALSAQDSTYDVFALYVIWIPEFAASNWVIPLDGKVNKDDFLPGPIEGATYNGKLYAVPFYIDAGLIYYRTDIIKEPPKTWDELIKIAKENMGKNDTKYGYVFQAKQYEGMVCDALELIHTYGGRVLDDNGKVVINSPEALAGLKKYIELVQSGIAPEGVTTYTET